MIALSIRSKLALVGGSALLLACAGVGGFALHGQRTLANHAVDSALHENVSSIREDIAAQTRMVAIAATTIASTPEAARLVAAGSRADLLERYSQTLAQLSRDMNIQLLTFVRAPGIAIARVHNPGSAGDDITGRRKVVSAALQRGTVQGGLELSAKLELSVFASAPLTIDGKVIGLADAGTVLGAAYFKRLKGTYGADVAVLVRNGNDYVRQAAQGSDANQLSAEEIEAAYKGETRTKLVVRDGATLGVIGAPVKDFSGSAIGVLEIVVDVTGLATIRRESLWQTVVASLIVAAVGLLAFLGFATTLTRPIDRLRKAMDTLAGGTHDIEVRDTDRRDEIGGMAKAVQVFKDNAIRARALEEDAAATRRAAEEERVHTDALRRSSRRSRRRSSSRSRGA